MRSRRAVMYGLLTDPLHVPCVRTSSYTDDNVVKLFQITQLTIEYMMNVQSTLHQRAVDLERLCRKATAEARRSQQETARLDDDIAELRREIHQKRKTIRTYEALLAQAKKPVEEPPRAPELPQEVFKCEHCGKLFRSGTFLDTHRSRRHSAPVPPPAPVIVQSDNGLRSSIDEMLVKEEMAKRQRSVVSQWPVHPGYCTGARIRRSSTCIPARRAARAWLTGRDWHDTITTVAYILLVLVVCRPWVVTWL